MTGQAVSLSIGAVFLIACIMTAIAFVIYMVGGVVFHLLASF